VAAGDLLHHFHGQLVVVRGHVGGEKYGGQLVLRGGDLVMLGFCQHAQLPQLVVKILHKLGHARLYDAEVMVVHLLALGGHGTEKGAPGEYKILAKLKHGLVHQKIFLFGAGGGLYMIHVSVAEEFQHTHCLLVQSLHGAQQRGLAVQRFTAVGTEGGGNAQYAILDKGVGGGIPGGVAPGLKGGAQAAGGEGGGVGLAAYKVGAGKLHYHAAAAYRGDKAVVLLGGYSVQGVEPVGEMSGAVFDGPILHGVCHDVRHLGIKALPVLDGGLKLPVGLGRKPLTHNVVIEDHGTEDFGCTAHYQNPFQCGKITK